MTRVVDAASERDPRAHVVSHVVGRVAGIWRYPVKSMGAESLDAVDVSWHGLAGDRRWAFVRHGTTRSGFPWLTIRERPDMGHYRPSFVDPDRPDASPTMVRTPSGRDLDVVDPALAGELGPGVRVLKQDRGVFDTMPLSLITTRTIAGLGALVGTDLDVLRFRPNLLIEPLDDAPLLRGRVGRPRAVHRRAAHARRPARPALRHGQRRSGHHGTRPVGAPRHRPAPSGLPRRLRLDGAGGPGRARRFGAARAMSAPHGPRSVSAR
jgi:hypothetical protein